MEITIEVGRKLSPKFLTIDELESEKLYLSSMQGSNGFIFFRPSGKDATVLATSGRYFQTASTGHERDFYEAPKGTRIIMEQ